VETSRGLEGEISQEEEVVVAAVVVEAAVEAEEVHMRKLWCLNSYQQCCATVL
jgi:hypothetical protein